VQPATVGVSLADFPLMPRQPSGADTTERIRKARRNLAQAEELHTLVGRLLKEADTLLASIDEPNDTDAGSRGSQRFKRRS
jgi:hypothetical protein